MIRFALAALTAALLHSGAVEAAELGKRMLGAREAAAWRGVGRLNVAGTRFCTAALISEREALTAAHCLYNPRTGKRAPLAMMRFVAGLRLGGHAAARRVTAARALAGYRYSSSASFGSVASDVAVLTLESPIDAATAPAFAIGARPPRGEPLTLVSYARDRAHAPSIEDVCRVSAEAGRVAAIDCDVTFGASGAPVFAGRGERRRIVGVVSATAKSAAGAHVGVMVYVEGALDRLVETRAEAPD
mgnify:FL=1